MIECPACAGPVEQRLDCATCKGDLEVTQEVYDSFMMKKERQERYLIFVTEATQLLNSSFEEEITVSVGETVITYSP